MPSDLAPTPSTADHNPSGAASRAAYLVLGMHRSGTSAVTQLLALAGAGLPANVMPGDEHNQKGYFEPWRIAMFNDERLRASGGAWDDIFGFPFRPLARKDERKWLTRGEALIEDEYGDARYPLLKDPRVTVLMPFWRTLFDDLGMGARCVIPVRHPLAVAGSLGRRDGFPPQKSVLLWTSYMLAAEAYTRDLPRVFVDYDSLLGDWRAEAQRIEAAHGAPLPRLTDKAARSIDRFLSPALRHNDGHGDLRALGWAGELAQMVFDELRAAAADRPANGGALELAADALARKREEIGPLISPVTREADALRLELRETRDRLAEEVRRRERELAEVRKAWHRDVSVRERELKVFYQAVAEAEAKLDEALAKP